MYSLALWVNLMTTLNTLIEVSTPILKVPLVSPLLICIEVTVRILLKLVSKSGEILIVPTAVLEIERRISLV